MTREHLRETIRQLHHQLDTGSPLSREQMDALRGALRDIEELLDSGGGAGADHESLLVRLREAEERFEMTHPNFASAVRSVTDALSKLGI